MLKPLLWIIICFIVSLFLKKTEIKRRLVLCGIILLFFFTNPFISNEIVNWWEIAPIEFNSLKRHDVGIVLTGVSKDSPPKDRVHYTKGADRVLHTIQLYKLGKINSILITGGSGLVNNENNDIESLNLMNTMLLAGVPDSIITLETESKNTYENANNSATILRKKFSNQNYILITSAFHMRRANACFNKAGIQTKPFTVDLISEERKLTFSQFIPSLESLQAWEILIKEWTGILIYKMTGYI